ncbi:MAG: hypothetical protein LBV69_00620 [Bacteroidales bacterium]|jgi:hypothetical protein|nr:hypothetical protein [Bacteroidales bacterium]
MKIKPILFAILVLTTFQLKAQDKIITNFNDTINCGIISIENNTIKYVILQNEKELIFKNISLSDVKKYLRENKRINVNDEFENNNFQNIKTIEDSIERFKGVYYINDNRLTFKGLCYITQNNLEANNILNYADKYRKSAYIFGATGGFLVGWGIGVNVSAKYKKKYNTYYNYKNYELNTILFISGLAFCTIGITCDILKYRYTKKAVKIYNQSIREKYMKLDIGFSPTGIGLRLNF